jgi:hypothetical protein
MAIRLSRDSGRFCVVLQRQLWLDPVKLAAPLAAALGVPRSDTLRICRLQRGILFEGATEAQASAASQLLHSHGIDSEAIPDSALPLLPKAVHVGLGHVELEGLATPSIVGAGMPKLWPWRNLVLASAGVLIDPAVQAAGVVDKLDKDMLAEVEDRRSVATRQLDRARERVFPLAAELARPRQDFAGALQAAMTGTRLPQTEIEGFGKIDTVLDLVFTHPFERLRVTPAGRVTGLARFGNRAIDLHVQVAEVLRRAPEASMPAGTLALAHGADSGEYVFEDLAQFEQFTRWSYYWRLRRTTPQKDQPETPVDRKTTGSETPTPDPEELP